jgi:hypothetical protein
VKTKLPPDTKSRSINFAKIEFKTVPFDDRHKYEVHADFPLGAEIQVHFYRDGVNVQEIIITKDMGVPFRVERVPDLIAAPFAVTPSSGQRSMVRSVVVAFDAQFTGGVSVAVSDVDGSVRFISDRMVVTYAGLESRTTLKKFGAGSLILNVGGIKTMTVSPLFR